MFKKIYGCPRGIQIVDEQFDDRQGYTDFMAIPHRHCKSKAADGIFYEAA